MTESAEVLFLWQATYRPRPQPDSGKDWDLQLMALQKWGLRAEVYPVVRRSLQ